jgi:L-ribulose-5-phosphate 4-epimerase
MNNKYRDLRAEAFEANSSLPKLRLVQFTFGNVSAADRALGVFAIKPSGVPYELLTPEKMVIVDFGGKIVEGSLRPSSDTPTHAALYREWPAIGGICHTHSTYATAWAQTQQDIPIYGTTHADHLAMDVPCAPPLKDRAIEGDYEYETGLQIMNHLDAKRLSYRQVEMILLAGHGPFTWGRSAEKAVYNSAILENIAKLATLTLRINLHAPRLKPALIQKHYQRKHGQSAYYGQESGS